MTCRLKTAGVENRADRPRRGTDPAVQGYTKEVKDNPENVIWAPIGMAEQASGYIPLE